MFKKTKANSVDEYLESIPEERKEDFNFLFKLIQKTVPKLKVHFAYNMIGFGSFPYTNYKKEPIEWPVISLANQKQYISIYICSVKDGAYLAEKHKSDLGKVKVGKSCVSLKKKEDINLPVLKKVLVEASKNPGFGTLVSKK